MNFRAILLTRCQKEFERDKQNEVELEAQRQKLKEAAVCIGPQHILIRQTFSVCIFSTIDLTRENNASQVFLELYNTLKCVHSFTHQSHILRLRTLSKKNLNINWPEQILDSDYRIKH